MKIAVIGSGIIGLTLVKELLDQFPECNIELYDQTGFPSKGTSLRNSGVLHAGLYYKPQSLKSDLCKSGRLLLEQYIQSNSLLF